MRALVPRPGDHLYGLYVFSELEHTRSGTADLRHVAGKAVLTVD